MSKKDWTEKLRDRLENHQMAAPDDLWAGIEAGLDAAGKPSTGPRKRGAVVTQLRRWGVAAAVAALAVMGWQLTKDDAAAPDSSLSSVETMQPKTSATAHEDAMLAKVEPSAPSAADGTNASVSKVADFMASSVSKDADGADNNVISDHNVATDHNVVTDNNIADNADTKAPVPAASDHADNPSATDNNKSDIPSATNPSAHTTQPSSDFANHPTIHHHPTAITHHLTLALYGTNGLADSKNANGVRMAEPMASRYAMAAESMKRGAPTPVIYMAGYEEREQHRQPFTVGLSVGIPIGQRWTVTTGLAYTQLHADFLKIMNKRKLATEQDLQYVGCPVNLNYSILQTKRLRAYAAAGAQMDVNVKAKSVTEGVETEMKKDRLQLSTQAAVGLQLDVMPQVGVYVEPGVKYYFDNNSNVSTFFKDKPCNFNLQVGLRWNWE